MSEMIAAEPALAERLLHRLAGDETFGAVGGHVRAAADAGRPIASPAAARRSTRPWRSPHSSMWRSACRRAASACHDQALERCRRPLGAGVLVAISHEGGTRATNEALRAAREAGARTVLVTVGRARPAPRRRSS